MVQTGLYPRSSLAARPEKQRARLCLVNCPAQSGLWFLFVSMQMFLA